VIGVRDQDVGRDQYVISNLNKAMRHNMYAVIYTAVIADDK
jgi:hypothetical protein